MEARTAVEQIMCYKNSISVLSKVRYKCLSCKPTLVPPQSLGSKQESVTYSHIVESSYTGHTLYKFSLNIHRTIIPPLLLESGIHALV